MVAEIPTGSAGQCRPRPLVPVPCLALPRLPPARRRPSTLVSGLRTFPLVPGFMCVLCVSCAPGRQCSVARPSRVSWLQTCRVELMLLAVRRFLQSGHPFFSLHSSPLLLAYLTPWMPPHGPGRRLSCPLMLLGSLCCGRAGIILSVPKKPFLLQHPPFQPPPLSPPPDLCPLPASPVMWDCLLAFFWFSGSLFCFPARFFKSLGSGCA